MSLVLLPCSGVGVVLAVPAIVCGLIARRRINAHPTRYGGREIATAGSIIALISIILSVLAVIGLVALLIWGGPTMGG